MHMQHKLLMDKALLATLACPKCKSDIQEKVMFLICKKCSLAFPLLEGVPDMLVQDAWELKKAEKSSFKHDLRL